LYILGIAPVSSEMVLTTIYDAGLQPVHYNKTFISFLCIWKKM